MNRRWILTCLGCAAGAWMLWFGLGSRTPPNVPGVYREIEWADLVPKAWDPTKRYREIRLDQLKDSDPRTMDLLREMRETWDNAPTVGELDGVDVKLTGFVVPLEFSGEQTRELLLVPYFGACIHTPPPPANQIVHVTVNLPSLMLKTMSYARIAGHLRTQRLDSAMGVSGYELSAVHVEVIAPQ
jgi:uncharacterized protein